jgi:hypothetical protein
MVEYRNEKDAMTSKSHPLNVDFVDETKIPNIGKIGMTLCPGKY